MTKEIINLSEKDPQKAANNLVKVKERLKNGESVRVFTTMKCLVDHKNIRLENEFPKPD